MKKRALILSNSNLFTVYSQSVLKEDYECHVLNVRYPNEEMNKSEHFIQQIKDLFNEEFYQKGMMFSKHEFGFSQSFTKRLDQALKRLTPQIVFFEMKTLQPSEWLTLDHIHKHYSCPIAVFLPPEEDQEHIVLRLFKNGVKEVVTRLDEAAFRDIVRRNQ